MEIFVKIRAGHLRVNRPIVLIKIQGLKRDKLNVDGSDEEKKEKKERLRPRTARSKPTYGFALSISLSPCLFLYVCVCVCVKMLRKSRFGRC